MALSDVSPADDFKLLSVVETAEFLGLSGSTLERMRLDGSGPPFIKLGAGKKRAKVAYRISDIRAWIAGQRFTSTSEYSRPGK